MSWFGVSIASVILLDDITKQEEFPIYEDVYVLHASSEEELDNKIKETMGEISKAGNCNYGGLPAKQKCIGVRKINPIYNILDDDMNVDPPSDGTEITHSFFVAESYDDALLFGKGKAVKLLCIDNSGEY